MPLRIDRLKETRETLRLSQRELARRCGLAEMMIHRYESGKAEPTLATFEQITDQLHVSADYLLGLSDDPRSELRESDLQPNEAALLDAYRREGWSGAMHLIAERIAGK